MDISGPIRTLLPELIAVLPEAGAAEFVPTDAFTFFAHARVTSHFAPAALPAFMQAGASPLLTAAGPKPRAVYGQLALACMLRLLPALPRNLRDQMTPVLTAQTKPLTEAAQRLTIGRTPAVNVLWHYWLLVLAKKQLRLPVPDMLLKALWQRAWPPNRADGPLHAVTADAALDTGVYNDLCAIHAAYNAILLTQDFDLFPPVQRLIDWHVANSKSDVAGHEPWALAAFASLDATGTFAQRQLDSTTAPATANGASSIVLALLADALAAQEDIADL